MLSRFRVPDAATRQWLVFLSNNFTLAALTITAIYKSRWHIELFFKWIKQNLRIKAFFGITKNAVKTQIWVAIYFYLMDACLKKMHGIDRTPSLLPL